MRPKHRCWKVYSCARISTRRMYGMGCVCLTVVYDEDRLTPTGSPLALRSLRGDSAVILGRRPPYPQVEAAQNTQEQHFQLGPAGGGRHGATAAAESGSSSNCGLQQRGVGVALLPERASGCALPSLQCSCSIMRRRPPPPPTRQTSSSGSEHADLHKPTFISIIHHCME